MTVRELRDELEGYCQNNKGSMTVVIETEDCDVLLTGKVRHDGGKLLLLEGKL